MSDANPVHWIGVASFAALGVIILSAERDTGAYMSKPSKLLLAIMGLPPTTLAAFRGSVITPIRGTAVVGLGEADKFNLVKAGFIVYKNYEFVLTAFGEHAAEAIR